MNQDRKQQEEQLRDDIFGAIDEVSAALESGEQQRELAAGKLVEPLVARYHELTANLPAEDAERARIERGLGRLLTDLRRSASRLTQRATGHKAERAQDGGQPFLLTRAPSPFLMKSATPTHRRTSALDSSLSVGAELEAWCGKCKESRAHRVVVMHEKKPYRVQCVHCKSQHGYRTEPARATTDSETPRRSTGSAKMPVDPEVAKRRAERERLTTELQSAKATDVRLFDPAGLYKSGQILEHPKYGRGKIESITRGSLLVRFLDGLRPLSRS